MSTPNTPPDNDTEQPGPWDRAVSAVAWYVPELTGAAAAGTAAATVWAPLGAISAALAAWIASDQVRLARERRRVHRAVEQRTERAQLDAAEPDTEHADDDAHEHGSATGEQAKGERPGWEVAG